MKTVESNIPEVFVHLWDFETNSVINTIMKSVLLFNNKSN